MPTSDATAAPHVTAPDEGEPLRVGPNEVIIRLSAAQSGGRIGVTEYHVAPRFAAPPVPHWHTRDAWTAHVLRGTIRFRFADGPVDAAAGATVHVPPFCPFAWENPSEEPAVMLCVYTPGGFEEFFRDAAALQAATPGRSMAERMPQLLELWSRYGIERGPHAQ